MVDLKVKVTFDEEMLGTTPGDPEIHKRFIASKAPDASTMKEEVEKFGTEEVFEKDMTGFIRNEDGNPIVQDYQWKGFLKDSIRALRKISKTECSKMKAYKKEVDKLIFVYPRDIPITLPKDGKIGICQRPLRAETAQGDRVALASSESVPAGSTMIFNIRCLVDSDEKAVMETLRYGRMSGFGQWRNSGKGKFHFEILEREESETVI